MTCSLRGMAGGRKGPHGPARRRCIRSASRWLGALLATALFGVDTFQPVIGLVEVTQRAGARDKPARVADRQDDTAVRRRQPVVISLRAWQWHQSCGELWPTFVFQPTINAGSGGARSEFPGNASAALPPVPRVCFSPALAAVRSLTGPADGVPGLRGWRCPQILPIGPPAA
jgi:hypothetical protein